MNSRIERSIKMLCVCAMLWVVIGEGNVRAEEIPMSVSTETETDLPERTAETATYQTLSSGAKGADVVQLQERLIELGYEPGTADGVYGSETKKAVRTFQKVNGLETDGVAGPKTQAALYADTAIQAPDPPEAVNVLENELPMLVNKEHRLEEDFHPANLVKLNEVCDPALAKIKYKETWAVQEAADSLIRLLEAAKADGVGKWQISAAYRSYESQSNTLNAKINSYLKRNSGWSRKKARSAALQTVAEPGASEHQLGLAIDINVPGASTFLGTRQCEWLHANCWEYGFIVRYPKGKESITGFAAEAWHIRYVGVEHARVMQKTGLCLEEYLEGIADGTIEMPLPELEEEILLE